MKRSIPAHLGPVLAALSLGAVSSAPAQDYAVLQFPATITVGTGSATPLIFGQFYSPGITEPPGPAASVVGEIGYGPTGSDPTVNPGAWTWASAVFNAQYGNNDEYMATFTFTAPGSFDYAARFSRTPGTWVYGDLDGNLNGYSADQAGKLTVTATPGFYPVPPCRLVDTRATQPLDTLSTRTFVVTGACEIPAAAASISVNMVGVGPAAAGYITLFPGDAAVAPVVSSLNFSPGQTRANNAIVLASDGTGRLNVKNGSAGTLHFVLDVTGYFY
jgi:hypothetical protein